MTIAFHDALLNWYDLYGRKDLPWQNNKTAYRVWISEVMLQQTQVKTVISFYLAFMKQFPTVKRLANASTDEVLSLWTGLGYYSRARNLHKASQQIVELYNGQLPREAAELISLPGIGRSTAHAILSIAYDQPKAILDGNVKRVLCRHYGIHGNPYESAVEKHLWFLSDSLLPTTRNADFTQAIMDLGATVCTRSKPACKECPLMKKCLAYKNKEQHLLPQKKKSKKLPVKETTFLIIQNKIHKILLERRPETGLWGGLWVPPQGDYPEITPYKAYRHTFSHFHLDMRFIVVNNPSLTEQSTQSDWFDQNDLKKVGLPRPIHDTLNHYFNDQSDALS